MTSAKVAAISGKIGDTVACMASLYELWKSDGEEWTLLLNETGDPRVFENDKLVMTQLGHEPMHFTRAACEFIKPLLEAQPYIREVQTVDYFTKELPGIDINFDRFRAHFMDSGARKRTGTNLEYLPKDMLGLPLTHTKQWLFNVEAKQATGKEKSMCIARSCRYQSAHLPLEILFRKHREDAFFIGTDLEHNVFEECFGLGIPHVQVKDALDAAQLIAGSKRFVSNGTAFLWIAYALGHPSILSEVGCEVLTTVYKEQLPNITYVLGGRVFT